MIDLSFLPQPISKIQAQKEHDNRIKQLLHDYKLKHRLLPEQQQEQEQSAAVLNCREVSAAEQHSYLEDLQHILEHQCVTPQKIAQISVSQCSELTLDRIQKLFSQYLQANPGDISMTLQNYMLDQKTMYFSSKIDINSAEIQRIYNSYIKDRATTIMKDIVYERYQNMVLFDRMHVDKLKAILMQIDAYNYCDQEQVDIYCLSLISPTTYELSPELLQQLFHQLFLIVTTNILNDKMEQIIQQFAQLYYQAPNERQSQLQKLFLEFIDPALICQLYRQKRDDFNNTDLVNISRFINIEIVQQFLTNHFVSNVQIFIETVRILDEMLAAGQRIPPLFEFRRKRLDDQFVFQIYLDRFSVLQDYFLKFQNISLVYERFYNLLLLFVLKQPILSYVESNIQFMIKKRLYHPDINRDTIIPVSNIQANSTQLLQVYGLFQSNFSKDLMQLPIINKKKESLLYFVLADLRKHYNRVISNFEMIANQNNWCNQLRVMSENDIDLFIRSKFKPEEAESISIAAHLFCMRRDDNIGSSM